MAALMQDSEDVTDSRAMGKVPHAKQKCCVWNNGDGEKSCFGIRLWSRNECASSERSSLWSRNECASSERSGLWSRNECASS
uniref:Uncharacterized protein n=1 Tax=Knipowitschia caucasica TaxID=637954 RepID=A0AAV2J897_KNICA